MRSKRSVRRPSLDYHDTVDKAPSRSPSSTRSTSVESDRVTRVQVRGCNQRKHASNNGGEIFYSALCYFLILSCSVFTVVPSIMIIYMYCLVSVEETTGLTPAINRMSMRRSVQIGSRLGGPLFLDAASQEPSTSQAIETDSRGCTPG